MPTRPPDPSLRAPPPAPPEPTGSAEDPGRAGAAPGRPGLPLSLAVLLIVLAVVAVYGQLHDHAFVSWDDPSYILNNPRVNQGLAADDVAWALTGTRMANWHPLTWWSHQLDVELFGLEAGGHHLMSAALHTLSAVLLFILLARATGARWSSLAVALLFAVHPLRVESVAWASERKDVLSGLCFMLAVLCHVAHARRPRAATLLGTTAAVAAGLMAKPMLVTAPFALLLLDAWPLGRWRGTGGPSGAWPLVREKLPMVVLALGTVAVTLWAQADAGAVKDLETVPAAVRLVNVPAAYAAYLGKAAWPVDLSFYYPLPREVDGTLVALAALGAALLLGVSLVAARRRRSWPFLFSGWFLFVGMLVPVIGIVQVGTQARADRYAYLPLVGLELAVVFGLARLVSVRPALRTPVVGAVAAALVALAVAAHHQTTTWHGSLRLYRHGVRAVPENAFAHNNLGLVFQNRGRLADAGPCFERAVELEPSFYKAWVNLGNQRRLSGDLDGAAEALARAQELVPGGPEVLLALTHLAVEAGDIDLAEKRLLRLGRLAGDDPDVAVAGGRLLMARGRHGEAIQAFGQVLARWPDHAEAAARLVEARARRRGAAAEPGG